ncbi:MAG: molybdopterin-dependent oxidoreductase [Deltaproteobacteria bacterium]|nr:molybdopterin-dependent oxidoreductase [Deltaproteobacteria bacterium]
MKINRRKFIIGIGGTAMGTTVGAVAGLKGKTQTLEETAALIEEWSNLDEEFKVSVCAQCPGGCGLLCRVVDGRLIRVSGNPIHPVNKGGVCVKGLSSAQSLYDPDRLKAPMRRTGKRGAHQWRPISWEEALKEVAEKMTKTRKNPNRFVFLGGQYRGLTDELFSRFSQVYGSPNYIRHRNLTPEKTALSHYYTQGLERPLCFDLKNSRTILSFGCNLLESWISPVQQLRNFGEFRSGKDNQRGRLVQVDSRLSMTAAKADQWIPINPGTDGALAMGLVYIIIQEGLYNRKFVSENCFGFDDWVDKKKKAHKGFKNLVLEGYAPEKVSKLTGVPVADLFKIAREFTSQTPSVALGERGLSYHNNDLYTRMAIHSLNAMVGNIGEKGGCFIQGSVPYKKMAEVNLSPQAIKGLQQPRIDLAGQTSLFNNESMGFGFHENILADNPYPVEILFLYYTNPLFSRPDSEAFRSALNKIPFIVSFSPFMDETSQQADLILPDHTFLERWQDDQITHLADISAFSLSAPVVEPLYDTRQTQDVILELAGLLGKDLRRELPWKSYQEFLSYSVQGLYESQRGHITDISQEEALENILARQGYSAHKLSKFSDFWELLLKRGVWWDAQDSYRGIRQLLKTPSGKFEFYSRLLEEEFGELFEERGGDPSKTLESIANKFKIKERGDLLFLPHFEQTESVGDPADYPFLVNSYKLMSLAGGRSSNQPILLQQPAFHLENGWESWVEINPHTAERLGIHDGDLVYLESQKAKIKVKARLYPGCMPDVLNMPYGLGHTEFGRWARNRGANPNDILISQTDSLSGTLILGSTKAKIYKA